MADKYEQILKTLKELEKQKIGEIEEEYKTQSDWLQDAVKSLFQQVKLVPRPRCSQSSGRKKVEPARKGRGKRPAPTALETVFEEEEEEETPRQLSNDEAMPSHAAVAATEIKEEPESEELEIPAKKRGRQTKTASKSKAASNPKAEPAALDAPPVRATRSRVAAKTATLCESFPSPPKTRKTRAKKAKTAPVVEPPAEPAEEDRNQSQQKGTQEGHIENVESLPSTTKQANQSHSKEAREADASNGERKDLAAASPTLGLRQAKDLQKPETLADESQIEDVQADSTAAAVAAQLPEVLDHSLLQISKGNTEQARRQTGDEKAEHKHCEPFGGSRQETQTAKLQRAQPDSSHIDHTVPDPAISPAIDEHECASNIAETPEIRGKVQAKQSDCKSEDQLSERSLPAAETALARPSSGTIQQSTVSGTPPLETPHSQKPEIAPETASGLDKARKPDSQENASIDIGGSEDHNDVLEQTEMDILHQGDTSQPILPQADESKSGRGTGETLNEESCVMKESKGTPESSIQALPSNDTDVAQALNEAKASFQASGEADVMPVSKEPEEGAVMSDSALSRAIAKARQTEQLSDEEADTDGDDEADDETSSDECQEESETEDEIDDQVDVLPPSKDPAMLELQSPEAGRSKEPIVRSHKKRISKASKSEVDSLESDEAITQQASQPEPAASLKTALSPRQGNPTAMKQDTGAGASVKKHQGPNLVTAHRTLVPTKTQPQSGFAAGKKAAEVDALKAAEAAKRKEAAREAARQKQKEALTKQKNDRAKHAQQVKANQEEALRKAAEEARQRENAAKRKEEEAAARRRAREEAEKRDKEEKARRLEEAKLKKKQADIRKQEDAPAKRAREAESKAHREPLQESNSKRPKVADFFSKAAASLMAPLKSSIAAPSSVLGSQEPIEAAMNAVAALQSSADEKKQPFPAMAPVPEGIDSIEIAPYRSEGETSEEDEDQEIPMWAQAGNLRRQIVAQQRLDPDELFQQHEKSCPLNEVFDKENRKEPWRDLTRRTSTGNWLEDRVTWKEEMNYKKAMGYL